MAIDPKILELLVCPETHAPLAAASPDLIAQVNAKIAAGQLSSHGGTAIADALTEALVRDDQACLYRVDDGIPNMLVEDRIDL